MVTSRFFGGIDAGGTTFKCGLSDGDGNIVRKHRFDVTTPAETIGQCLDFFRTTDSTPLQALGIACFGPLDIDPRSETYGALQKTPKPNWSGFNVAKTFEKALNVPVAIDTDVNGALIAEARLGAARGVPSAAYITVGTGIGAGLLVNGRLAGRPSHPEFGHIPIRKHVEDTDFKSLCPFHEDCLEGLASAKAITARVGEPRSLGAGHAVWDIQADYLAQACRVLFLTARPQRIILGGGLMLAPHLLELVRQSYVTQMAGYVDQTDTAARQLIVRPHFGDDAGLAGAICLAMDAQDTGAK